MTKRGPQALVAWFKPHTHGLSQCAGLYPSSTVHTPLSVVSRKRKAAMFRHDCLKPKLQEHTYKHTDLLNVRVRPSRVRYSTESLCGISVGQGPRPAFHKRRKGMRTRSHAPCRSSAAGRASMCIATCSQRRGCEETGSRSRPAASRLSLGCVSRLCLSAVSLGCNSAVSRLWLGYLGLAATGLPAMGLAL